MIPHPVVDVRDATVRLDGRPVLHGLTMRVEVGELLVLLGPNGSGKSTLVRATIGLVPLATGQVRLFDTPLNRFRAWARIGYVPQRATAGAGVPATVAEVAGSGRLAGARWWRGLRRTDREATGRALELVGLADRAGDRVGALSGGQQQRVLIARALTMEPDLLVMDEPMAGVDIAHQEAFAGTVERLLRDGRTIVLVAHELGALERLVHRTVILRGGEVLYDGPPPPSDPRADHTHPHAAPTGLADTSSLRWQL